jgi:predicted nucleic acid-binding protein
VLVLDSSAAVDYLLDLRPRSTWIAQRLSEAGVAIAPHLIDVEVASFLRREVARGLLPEGRALTALAHLASMRLIRYPHLRYLDRVWELRHGLTPYDAVFVALAEDSGLPLLTSDARLARAKGVNASILTPPA